MGLDTVELAMAFEEEFEVDIPDAEAAHMVTPRIVIDYMLQHSPQALSRDEIAARVREIILHQLGLAALSYDEDKRFIEDFGAD